MNRLIKVVTLVCLLTILLSALSFKTTEAKTITSRWQMFHGHLIPHSGQIPSKSLNGVATISANNAWAVGLSLKRDGFSQTLIEHWNGHTCSVVTSPSPGKAQNALSEIVAVSANNMWTVGSSANDNSSSQTLTEHWNGSRWSVVTSPNPPRSTMTVLNSVAATSASDVWAVGAANGFTQTLIEHWNGHLWSIVTSPNPGQINLLDGVAAVSAHDIWAVGQSLQVNGNTLIVHWNGHTWSAATSPNAPGSVNNALSGIAVISAHDIWAVGFYQSSNLVGHTLTEHWNGSAWKFIKSPDTESMS